MVTQALLAAAVGFEGRYEGWYAQHRGSKVFAEEKLRPTYRTVM